MFTASNGTQFDLSGLYGKDVDIMPAREFAAALFKSNAVIPWPCFHPASLMQITAHLRKTHNPADIEGRRKGKNVCTCILLYHHCAVTDHTLLHADTGFGVDLRI